MLRSDKEEVSVKKGCSKFPGLSEMWRESKTSVLQVGTASCLGSSFCDHKNDG